MDPKKNFFTRYTLEENKINKSFKIEKKRHTKHHQIDLLRRIKSPKITTMFQMYNHLRKMEKDTME